MDKPNSRINPHDTVVLFADLQAGIVELTQTNPLERLKTRIRALAKLAKLLDIPAIVFGIRGEDGSPARVVSEIADGLGALPTYHRTTCDSFLSEEIVSAVQATGRKTLLISGVATELAVQLPALTASDQGYRVYVVLDACRRDERAHRTGGVAPHRESGRDDHLCDDDRRRVGWRLPRGQGSTGHRNSV
jgi:nicotinamidase-related amidase